MKVPDKRNKGLAMDVHLAKSRPRKSFCNGNLAIDCLTFEDCALDAIRNTEVHKKTTLTQI